MGTQTPDIGTQEKGTRSWDWASDLQDMLLLCLRLGAGVRTSL